MYSTSTLPKPYPDRHLKRQLHGDDDDDDDDDRGSSSHSHQDGGRNTSSRGIPTAMSTSALPTMSLDANTSRKNNSGAIAGGVIGALIGFALLTFIFWLWWKRRSRRGRKSQVVLDDEYTVKDGGKTDGNSTILERFFANNRVIPARHGREDSAKITSDIPKTQYTPVANIQSHSTNWERPHVRRSVANPDPTTIVNNVPASEKSREASSYSTSGRGSTLLSKGTSGKSSGSITSGALRHQSSNSSLPNPHPTVQNLASPSSEPQNHNNAIRTVSIDTPEEKRQLVRLSIDGLQVDGHSSRARSSVDDSTRDVDELQRRVEALTRENEILTLSVQAPPAYQ
ncbi:hypothetical protein PQX77_014627 [Marasmius sp. AFHP31]|nr:hypothetical protein PQX77_019063 [Marasmius sp. AFHP31]KAK1222513.1 hypothetical protein PQX77_014627 [Marasmius sp. AFHP31]